MSLRLLKRTLVVPRLVRLTKKQRAIWNEFAPKLEARNRTNAHDAICLAQYAECRVEQARYANWYPRAYKETRKQVADIEQMYRERVNHIARLLGLPRVKKPPLISRRKQK